MESARQLQVIVAEDEPIACTRLMRTIQRLGHPAHAAQDGARAWVMFAESGADVLITDWMMPGMDGPELCRRVRAHANAAYTYVIIVTALERHEHVKEALEAGADDYLVKPLTLEDIEARLIVAARVTAVYRERADALAHRETLLRIARNFAAESDPERILSSALLERRCRYSMWTVRLCIAGTSRPSCWPACAAPFGVARGIRSLPMR